MLKGRALDWRSHHDDNNVINSNTSSATDNDHMTSPPRPCDTFGDFFDAVAPLRQNKSASV